MYFKADVPSAVTKRSGKSYLSLLGEMMSDLRVELLCEISELINLGFCMLYRYWLYTNFFECIACLLN